MIKRINFYGGPGSGKSTVAAKLFAELKARHYTIELIDEVIKGMAWQKIPPRGFDSVWIFGKQLHKEDIVLRAGACVVTGSPLMQQLVYMAQRNEPYTDGLADVIGAFNTTYPALNIYLKRDVPYHTAGRFQDNEDVAKVIDNGTVDTLDKYGVNYFTFTPHQFDRILELALDVLPNPAKRGNDAPTVVR